jgi:hypothetical protein
MSRPWFACKMVLVFVFPLWFAYAYTYTAIGDTLTGISNCHGKPFKCYDSYWMLYSTNVRSAGLR